MSIKYDFQQEYKKAVPDNQQYSNFPSTKAAEKAWWKDYYRKNPTLIMKIVSYFKGIPRSHA